MPNGGGSCSYECPHFDESSSTCQLRKIVIDNPYWTTCKNYMGRNPYPIGPLYAVLGVIHNGGSGYTDLPYTNGTRPESIRLGDNLDTTFEIMDIHEKPYHFETEAQYLEYYRENDLQNKLEISREIARELGKQAIEILSSEGYVTCSGSRIDLKESILRSVSGTVTYFPTDPLGTNVPGNESTKIGVQNQTTLATAKSLIENGFNPVALNLASATSPGGGFLSGSRAQEEYLARSSALYACLRGNPMYSRADFHTNPFYDDYVIYSPDVIVFRNDRGELLDQPYACSIITSPAVQANAVRNYLPHRVGEIEGAMWKRILKVLAVAHKHGHDSMVLGAWGCGAFGNNGQQIAGLFKKALSENFKGVFTRVDFAITDWSLEKRFIGPFLELQTS